MGRIKIIIILICLLFKANVQAQSKDSLIKNNEVNIIKIFKPILSEAIKIPVNPNPEKPELMKRTFIYQIPDQQFMVQPTLYTIKPLALGTALLPKLKNNYFKLGFGNYTTPLAEIYYNSVRNKQRQAGIFARHLSSDGDQKFNDFSNNTIYGYIKQFAGKGSYGLDAGYFRNAVKKYGAPVDSIKNQLVYQLFDLKGYYQNYTADTNGLIYKFDLGYYNYTSNYGVNESDIRACARIGKLFNEVPFELITSLQINNTKRDSGNSLPEYEEKRIYFDFNPQITLHAEDYYLKGGFNSTLFNNSSGSTLHFFPKVEGAYSIILQKLLVLLGFSGNLKQNSFRSITNENPFASTFQLRNTLTKFEVYGGFRGQLTPMTNFSIMASSATIQNMLFYSLDSLSGRQVTIYDTLNGKRTTYSIHINHGFNEKIRVGCEINIYGYKFQTLDVYHAYTRPEFEAVVNATYNMGDKFLFKLTGFYMDQRWGRYNNSATAKPNYIDKKILPYVDLNLGIDYRYNKDLSAFITINNITNNRYQKFYNYPVYGINILGGFTFTF